MYPLTIDRKEEEFVRKMARKINDDMKYFQENYAVKDKQDLLAMIALQLATESSKESTKTTASADVIEELESVIKLADTFL